MNEFTFSYPTRVYFGKGAAAKAFSGELPAMGRKILLAYGGGSMLRELKSKVEITPQLLRKVADTCNIVRCNPRTLSRDEVYDILMECC